MPRLVTQVGNADSNAANWQTEAASKLFDFLHPLQPCCPWNWSCHQEFTRASRLPLLVQLPTCIPFRPLTKLSDMKCWLLLVDLWEPRVDRSHNRRLFETGRDHSWSSGPSSMLKQGHTRAHGTGLCPDGSWRSPMRDTTIYLKNLLQCPVTCTVEKFFLNIQVKLIFLYSLSSCCLALGRAWLHLFMKPPFRYLQVLVRSLVRYLFLRLNMPSSFSSESQLQNCKTPVFREGSPKNKIKRMSK